MRLLDLSVPFVFPFSSIPMSNIDYECSRSNSYRHVWGRIGRISSTVITAAAAAAAALTTIPTVASSVLPKNIWILVGFAELLLFPKEELRCVSCNAGRKKGETINPAYVIKPRFIQKPLFPILSGLQYPFTKNLSPFSSPSPSPKLNHIFPSQSGREPHYSLFIILSSLLLRNTVLYCIYSMHILHQLD